MKKKLWRPRQDQDYVLMISSAIITHDHIVDPQWKRKICKQLCPECNWPSHLWHPRPVDMVLVKPIKASETRLDVMGPLVLRKSLYAYLHPYNSTAPVGQVFLRGPKSENLETEYVTLYEIEADMVEIRGFVRPGYVNECELCRVRCKWIEGNQWVRRNDLDNRKWFTEGVCLCVSRWLDERIPWKQFPDIQKYRVYIRDDDEA